MAALVLAPCFLGADGVEREDAPTSSVRSIPMMAPSLVVLVRILWVILRYHKQDVYWMVADLTLGKQIANTISRPVRGPDQATQTSKRIGIWSSPEGREYRVESQAIRPAPDHHPRLQ